MTLNINDLNVVVDFINKTPMEHQENLVAITNVITCNSCNKTSDFDPMISTGSVWLCLDCWNETNTPVSVGVMERMDEICKTARANYLIRNM